MPAKDDFDMLGQLAERLGLDDDEKDGFISSSMERLGHKRSVSWEDNQEGDSGSGDFFSKKRERQTRQVPTGNRRTGTDGGNSAGWQYQ